MACITHWNRARASNRRNRCCKVFHKGEINTSIFKVIKKLRGLYCVSLRRFQPEVCMGFAPRAKSATASHCDQIFGKIGELDTRIKILETSRSSFRPSGMRHRWPLPSHRIVFTAQSPSHRLARVSSSPPTLKPLLQIHHYTQTLF